MSYFFGSINIKDKEDFYIQIVRTLIDKIEEKIKLNREGFQRKIQDFQEGTDFKRETFSSGIFFSFPEKSNQLTDSNLKSLISMINPDIIICIKDDELKVRIEKIFNNKYQIVRIQPNSGVTTLLTKERRLIAQKKIQNKFLEGVLCLREKVSLEELNIFQIESINRQALGDTLINQNSELRISKIDPQINDIKGKVMAILKLKYSEEITLQQISSAEILDMVYVFEIDRDKQMTLIRPSNIIKDYLNYVLLVGDVGIN